ncbi:alpha/beta fold hydrolase [Pendulispora albinea]|uniref:Alpha/beta hydrolase n=1 Tax=Pendulispora albinea TaxID=2741071 RepID=A0ABZ2LY46_9BACT
MSTYVLIHGAGGSAWDWHLVEPELRARGHEVIAMDLPCDDDSTGLSEYADAVIAAIGGRTDLIVVGHSLGGFTAPLVCDRVPVQRLVFLAGMIPKPGETPGEWWAASGYERMAREQEAKGERATDEVALFMHDVPPELLAEATRRGRNQSGTPMEKPWPLQTWPSVPTSFVLCRDDRFFPASFLRQLAKERLGITADEIDGSHCVYLSRPAELAARLAAYAP